MTIFNYSRVRVTCYIHLVLALSCSAFVSPRANARFSTSITDASSLLEDFAAGSGASCLLDDDVSSSSCPFSKLFGSISSADKHRTIQKDQRVLGKATKGLRKVFKLPVFGSLLTPGVPNYSKMEKQYQFTSKMRERFGDFYQFGNPLLQNDEDLTGTNYVTTDPEDYERVLKAEGRTPYGAFSIMRIPEQLRKEVGDYVDGDDVGLLSNSDRWKPLSQMARDIAGVSRLASFGPTVARIAKQGSKSAGKWNYEVPEKKNNAAEFLTRFYYDIVGAIVYGEELNTTDPDRPQRKAKDLTAAEIVMPATSQIFEEIFSFTQKGRGAHFLDRTFPENRGGSSLVQLFHKAMGAHIAKREDLEERLATKETKEEDQQQQVTMLEMDSMIMRVIRTIKQGKFPSHHVDTNFLIFIAPFHTTRANLFWVMIHLALNPEVQQKLRRELQQNLRAMARGEQQLTMEMLSPQAAPYLHAILRETHRMTPVNGVPLGKRLDRHDVTIRGTTLPQGSMVTLDAYSIGMDETIVSQAKQFVPERWLPEAVAARKGTSQGILDHRLCNAKYSVGKRMCPGKDISENLLRFTVSQLVLDWDIQITSEDDVQSLDDIPYKNKASVTPLDVPVKFVSLDE